MSLQKQNYDYLINPDGTYPFVEPGGGIKGTKGQAGTPGEKGQKGAPGVDGTDGTDGTKGQKGDRGFEGLKGQKGEASSTVFDFQGQVPTVGDLPTTGNTEGDVYQVLSNENLYVWDGTTWLLLAANVDAIKGEDGLKGQKGDQGQKGATGADGADGTDGTDGSKGNKGQKGTDPDTDIFVTKTVGDQTYAQLVENNDFSGINTFQRTTAQPSMIVRRSEANTTENGGAAVAAFQITGGIKGSQNVQSDLLKTYNYPVSLVGGSPNPDGQPQSDYVRYFGRTDTPQALQTRTSCDDRYARLASANEFQAANTFAADTTTTGLLTSQRPTTGSAAIKINDPTGNLVARINNAGNGQFASAEVKCTGASGGLVLSDSSSTTNTKGALAFQDANANVDVGEDTYVLVQGRGNVTAGNLVFARDTTVGNVSNSDIYFKLQAPRSGNGSHDCETIFVQPVQGPTPTQDADLTTKAYVDNAVANVLAPAWVTLTLASGISGSARYRIIGGSFVQLEYNINMSGSNIPCGQTIFTIPASARPNTSTNFVGSPQAAGTSTAQGSFVMMTCYSSSGVVKVLSNDYQLTGPSLSSTSTVNNLIPHSSSGNIGPQELFGSTMWPLS